MIHGGGKFIVSTEAKWYEKYIGFPFLHLGNDPYTGIDCGNLVRYIYKQELGIELPYDSADFCNILDDDWYNKTHNKPFEQVGVLKYGWEKINSFPDVFNVITLTIGSTNCTNHCAIYVDKNRILHTMTEHESWIAPYGRYYQQYTTGIYKWNPVHIQV